MDFRRRLLLRALASVGPIACVAPRALTGPSPSRAGLADAIVHGDVPPAVDTLGRHLLQEHEAWLDRDALLAALDLAEPPADEAAWLRRLQDAVTSEVEAGEWVPLAGWQLTPTECRVYALAALSV